MRRKLQELAALDGHDLLATHIALVSGFPYDLVAVPQPAAVIDLDPDARPHQIFQQQREAETDRSAAGYRDAQDGHGAWRICVEAEKLTADDDLVAGLEPMNGHPSGIDPGAIAAAAVMQDGGTDAWYAAQAADAELGQSQAGNYPQIAADGEGGYLKLPIQFPGQTLVIRNEAFLPQIKVSYDLLDFGRTRAIERSAREQLIAANFAFNRAIQEVVFDVEKAY